MTSYLTAGPASEPTTLDEAKAFLRLDSADEDDLVTTLIAAARIHLESVTGRALIAQGWRIVLDDWPQTGFVRLPVTPLIALTAITAYDAAGEGHDIALAQFLPETGQSPARLFLPASVIGMPVLRPRMGIEIDYQAGYGSDAAAVPTALKQALLMLIGYWFENRDAVVIAGSGSIIPSGFDRLVAPYRAVRL
jgi:uncharacterized phiE125 gp8 family phage protein